MKLTVNSKVFAAAASAAQSACAQRGPIESLANALLSASDGVLRVSSTDLSTALTTEHPAVVTQPGAVTVDATRLSAVAKSLPPGEVVVEVDKRNRVSLSAGNAVFSLAGGDAEDFPRARDPEKSQPVTVSAAVLAGLIDRTAYAVAVDAGRGPAMYGVRFEVSSDRLLLVAVSGHTAALAQAPLEGMVTATVPALSLPRKGLAILHRMLSGLDTVTLEIGHNGCSVHAPGCVLHLQALEGQFPAYEQVLPAPLDTPAAVSRVALLEACSRVSLSTDSFLRITLSLTSDHLVLAAEDDGLASAADQVSVVYGGPPCSTEVNCKYVIDALKAFPVDALHLDIPSCDFKPIVIREPGTSNLAVIMPMKG